MPMLLATGMEMCINMELPDGGSLTATLPFRTSTDLRLFRDYINKKLTEMEKNEKATGK